MQEGERSGVVQLLRDPVFGPFISGRFASHLSVWIFNIVAAVLVFEITGSTFAVGMISVTQFMPQVLFSAWGGAISDRYDRRMILIAGRAPAGMTSLVLAFVVWSGADASVVLTTAYVVSVISGLGWAIGVPAGHAFTPSLVKREALSAAITLTSTTGHVSRMVGPAIAGLLLAGGDFTVAFAGAGAGHLAFVVVLAFLRVPGTPNRVSKAESRIRPAITYMLADRRFWLPIMVGGIVSLGMEPMVTLAPGLAVELGRSGSGAATIATGFGVGGVAAVAFVGRVRRRFGDVVGAILGLLVVAVGLGGVGLTGDFRVVMGLFAVAGFGSTVAVVALLSWIQHLVADELRGRVMSFWALSFLGSRTVSAALLGFVGDTIGSGAATSAAGVGSLLGALSLAVNVRAWSGTSSVEPSTGKEQQ